MFKVVKLVKPVVYIGCAKNIVSRDKSDLTHGRLGSIIVVATGALLTNRQDSLSEEMFGI